MKEYVGIDHETGKPLWYLNKEGDETTSDYNAAAKRYVGDADPKVLEIARASGKPMLEYQSPEAEDFFDNNNRFYEAIQ